MTLRTKFTFVLADFCRKTGIGFVTGYRERKTTTLASMIDLINREQSKHILTLEDPIEFIHFHKKSIINQREIGNDSSSFAEALRAGLRQDPDVILVGEMRDLETISIAITAAETGHLVFATLHTSGTAQTVEGIIIDVSSAVSDQSAVDYHSELFPRSWSENG